MWRLQGGNATVQLLLGFGDEGHSYTYVLQFLSEISLHQKETNTKPAVIKHIFSKYY
jgi:hypothetical protein